MLDASLAFMTSAVVPYLVTGKALERTGNTGYSGQPTSALFEAGDGRMVSLGVVQPNQFAALAKHLGREDWLTDPRFSDPDLRRANSADMQAELGAELKSKGAAEWETEMSNAGIPCGMVREVGEAASLPHLVDRGAKLPLNVPGLPDGSEVEIINAGFRLGSDGPHVSDPPPTLGEHGLEILEDLGYSADEIATITGVGRAA